MAPVPVAALALLLLSLSGCPALRLSPWPRRMAIGVASRETSEALRSPSTASFVQDELRPYAMRLHTRDQAPREGKMPAQRPFTQWEVKLSQYVQVPLRH